MLLKIFFIIFHTILLINLPIPATLLQYSSAFNSQAKRMFIEAIRQMASIYNHFTSTDDKFVDKI